LPRTTGIGRLHDDAGTIHVVFCDVWRSVRIDLRTPARKAWTLWLSEPFTSTGQTFHVTLRSSQLQSGEVQVRFVDHGIPGLRVAGVLRVALLEGQSGAVSSRRL